MSKDTAAILKMNHVSNKWELDKDHIFAYRYFDGFTHRLLSIQLYVNILYQYSLHIDFFRPKNSGAPVFYLEGTLPAAIQQQFEKITKIKNFGLKEIYDDDTISMTGISGEQYFFNFNDTTLYTSISGLVTNQLEYFTTMPETIFYSFHQAIKSWTKEVFENLAQLHGIDLS
ncbi:hypothetical protein HYN59_12535 [Flavobacterium album]|uniref:Uncharacterized protein n=1 Tax=Flavobacterium album TaxID=2175091 RepID=A0A2S1QZP2_9FLAO|nr:hypothetical protein [Flavobacterium album]AWH85880.1 hypothetical protein HYN59_12535 [Flavobacterium album]